MTKAFLRIVIAVIVGCVSLWPAILPENWRVFAQSGIDPVKPKGNSGVKRKKKSDKLAIPLPVGITEAMLRGYDFATPVINSDGKVTSRKNGQARYFIEKLNGANLEMTLIPAGAFWMGSTDEEVQAAYVDAKRYSDKVSNDWFKNEQPRHRVNVRSFYMGRYDITIKQWRAVMGDIPEGLKKVKDQFYESDNQPIAMVSWDDAQEFCRRLSQATGRQYRLPSEAEWEYAARARSTTAFPFGDTITPEVVNYNGEDPYGNAAKGVSRGKTLSVGSLGAANAFGLYDMVGNIEQWCQDYYHDSYAGAPTDGKAWESESEPKTRILRGGCADCPAWRCRSAFRGHFYPSDSGIEASLRVVVSAK